MQEKIQTENKKILTVFTIIKYVAAIVLSFMAYRTVNSKRWILLCVIELCLIFFISQLILKHNKIIGNIFNDIFLFVYCIQMGVLTFGNSYLTHIMLSNINSFEALAEDSQMYIVLIVLMIIVCLLPACYMDIKAKIYNFKIIIPGILIIYIAGIFVCGRQCSPVYSMFDLCMQEIEYKKMEKELDMENPEEEFFKVVEDNRKKDTMLPEKPNVIIIFTEGMSSYIIEDDRNITPNIRRLMENSLSFSNYYNHTFATYHGLQGQLYSGWSLNDLDTNSLISVQDILADRGYHTMFINTEPYNNDFSTYLSSFEYNELVYLENETYLGNNDTMSDGQAYDFLFEKATELQKNNEPFLLTMYSFGTHMNMDSTDKKFQDGSNRVLNRFYNLDYEFGEFFDKFLNSSLKENTIIIFTTDHATYIDKDVLESQLDYEISVSLNRIPLFIYYDGIEPEVIDVGGRNSLDFAPTVIDYLDMESDAYFMGDSLFDAHAGNIYDSYYFDGAAYLSSKNCAVGEIPDDELEFFKKQLVKYFNAIK